jgi:hypothetical protein
MQEKSSIIMPDGSIKILLLRYCNNDGAKIDTIFLFASNF